LQHLMYILAAVCFRPSVRSIDCSRFDGFDCGIGGFMNRRLSVTDTKGGEKTKPVATKFFKFLFPQVELQPQKDPYSTEWSGTGNTIGALALRLGALTLNQIDAILQHQQANPKLFGEIGVQLGYMKPEAVARLIELQRLHLDLELGELLV